MAKKILLGTLILLSLALAVSVRPLQVAAQEPRNTFPGNATYLDNQWHFLPPNARLWYLFDYAGDRSMIELVLVDGFPNHLDFNVYTPEQVSLPDQTTDPIGRGTVPTVACETGRCPTNNLIWKGSFTGPGTFFVEVINNNPNPMPFLLLIAGSGVTLRQPTAAALPPPTAIILPTTVAPTPNAVLTALAAVSATLQAHLTTGTPTATVTVTGKLEPIATPTLTNTPTSTPTPTATTIITPTVTPTVTPTPTATPGPENFWPPNAIYVMDNRARWIPAYSELWFKFDYAGDRSQILIRIPDGNLMRLEFFLYTPDQMTRYELGVEYIGEGSAPLVPCETGRCPSNDLTWSGNFWGSGTYYLRVLNNNPLGSSFRIVISGTGVVLGR